ncbi:putative zinc finger CCHC domain-containing protein [Cocos nucifera]|uniref:Putative zinc finger CCHC domain-containing protein n=1 Tax=Cocos nucifera TaxID=13894 RepID=A0A8K0N539_COCNU|nr:putative zinc finger CCHC domain-containing protein [Cocos nucifera]
MEEEVTGGGMRLGKKPMEKEEEVDYKTKAGTAWSHSYLNQKPWHPLSYPNQRRKWIAEQTHSNRMRRAEEVAREFAQEQEFFRQTALFSKEEKEKLETMKAVSFMYVRPPGYNAESAKAAEIADEKRRPETRSDKNRTGGDKKARPKDVFGRPLPTEEEFEVLKNAPRLDTGAPVRIKPFGVEIRNVRCVRCGTYGHQSGDRECPLKDAIMPNEEMRLKRDDPLTAIMAHTDAGEPLKWELKQKPGMSPPRGGFEPDDPNQQIVADDIFDEYGGFLGGGDIPALFSNLSASKSKKHSKRKRRHKDRSPVGHTEFKGHHVNHQPSSSSDSEVDKERRRWSKSKHKKHRYSELSLASDSEVEVRKEDGRKLKSKHRQQHHPESSSTDSEFYEENRRWSKGRHKKQHNLEYSAPSYPEVEKESRRCSESRQKRQHSSESPSSDSIFDKESRRHSKSRQKQRYCLESPSSDSLRDKKSRRHSKRRQKQRYCSESPSSDSLFDKKSRRHSKSRQKKQHHSGSPSSDSIFDKESRRHLKSRPKQRHHSVSPSSDSVFDKESRKHSRSKQRQQHHSDSLDSDSNFDKKRRHSNGKQKEQHCSKSPSDSRFDKESRRHSNSKQKQ